MTSIILIFTTSPTITILHSTMEGLNRFEIQSWSLVCLICKVTFPIIPPNNEIKKAKNASVYQTLLKRFNFYILWCGFYFKIPRILTKIKSFKKHRQSLVRWRGRGWIRLSNNSKLTRTGFVGGEIYLANSLCKK